MTLPNQLKTARMSDATVGNTLDNHIGDLEQAICDIFGIPINTDISAQLLEVVATGIRKVVLADLAGDPSAVGVLARNATLLKFHDGVAARTVLLEAIHRHTKRKTASQAVNASVTLQNDSVLFIALPANSSYRFNLFLLYNDDSGGGIKVAWTLPAGANMVWNGLRRHGSSIYPGQGLLAADNLTAASVGSGIITVLWLEGIVNIGGTAGNLQLQWAQEVAIGITNVLADSVLTAWKT